MKSKDEAIEWLMRCPFAVKTDVEIRQIMSAEDYAPVFAATYSKSYTALAKRAKHMSLPQSFLRTRGTAPC